MSTQSAQRLRVFELVKSCPRPLTGQVKVACPGESMSLWTTNFDLFKKKQILTSLLKQSAIQRNAFVRL